MKLSITTVTFYVQLKPNILHKWILEYLFCCWIRFPWQQSPRLFLPLTKVCLLSAGELETVSLRDNKKACARFCKGKCHWNWGRTENWEQFLKKLFFSISKFSASRSRRSFNFAKISVWVSLCIWDPVSPVRCLSFNQVNAIRVGNRGAVVKTALCGELQSVSKIWYDQDDSTPIKCTSRGKLRCPTQRSVKYKCHSQRAACFFSYDTKTGSGQDVTVSIEKKHILIN